MGEQLTSVDRVRAWREGIARIYLTGISVGLPVVLLAWVVTRAPPRFDVSFFAVLAAWATFVAARLLAPGWLQATLLTVLLLAVGLGLAAVLGLSAGTFLTVLSGVIIGAAVFGRRVGFVLLAGSTAVFVWLGWLASRGALPGLEAHHTDPLLFTNWARVAGLFALATGMLLFVLIGLFERVEEAWQATAASAERERQEHLHRLRAEADRHAAQEQARASQRLEALGRLAGGVAHDFNNLLVVIMSWADLLPSLRSDDERREGLSAIRTSAGQAAQLTRQLLSFAKKQVAQPSAVDVDALVTTTLKALRRLLPGDVKFEHTPSGAPPAFIDEAQLSQVLLNLTLNAGDAMPRGGTLTIRTALVEPPAVPATAPDPAGRYVALSVEDTGVGMDEATRERIFEPFFSTKAHGRGTGLGLASVYGIVSQAKGWVHAESEPGKGARFTVAFPVAGPQVVAAHVAAPQAPTAVRPGARPQVLLVEDDASVRLAMSTALRAAGIEPVEAPDAEQALAIARRTTDRFELLCTDGIMPGLPTQVLIEGFRQLYPAAPVLLCTGYVEEALVQRGVADGTVAVLPKPFTAEALVSKVNELLVDAGRPPGGARPPAG